MARRKLIVVSNRGPVVFERAEGGVEARRAGGGLATALRQLPGAHDVTWVAAAFSEADRELALAAEPLEQRTASGARYRLRLVALDKEAQRLHYDVLANPTLWFVQHCLGRRDQPPRPEAEILTAWHEGYYPVNAAFAAAVAEELAQEPEALVLVHDYHLYLLPALLRELAPAARISHFTHIPWPEPGEWWRVPREVAKVVHRGLLAADVVGFHTPRWRDAFLAGCREILGVELDDAPSASSPLVVARPLSVDSEEFLALRERPDVLAEERALAASRPERLALLVARSDPMKNVPRGIRAFARYLDEHPQRAGRDGLLVLLDPSRLEIPEYVAEMEQIERAAAAANARFPSAVDLRVADDFPRTVAAYKQFDLLLVPSLYDGLNLVAKEAALVNERAGVLVLSRNVGAASELGAWVELCDPESEASLAQALGRAFALPAAERAQRLLAAKAQVRTHDLARWLGFALHDLERSRAGATGGG